MQGSTSRADEAIIAAIRADLDRGFTALVRAHQPGIYAGAHRLTGSRAAAEEIAQDTFLRAYKALDGYHDDRIAELSLAPWLWTIALNLCRNRAQRARPTSPLPAAESGVTDVEPLDDVAWNRRLALLSDSQRTAVVLRYVLDLSVSDIADITGRPVGTAKADISRGIARLRATIEAEEAR
jgi:RNA polymerase sigma-70 factor (ECF subfamily)